MNSSYNLKQKWKLDSPRFASAMLGPSSLLATLVLVQPSDAYSTDSRLDDKHITHVVVFYTWLSYTLHLFLRKKLKNTLQQLVFCRYFISHRPRCIPGGFSGAAQRRLPSSTSGPAMFQGLLGTAASAGMGLSYAVMAPTCVFISWLDKGYKLFHSMVDQAKSLSGWQS